MKKLLTLFAFLLCFASNAKGQTNIQSGPTNPTFCTPGAFFYNTATATYQQCGPANSWGTGTVAVTQANSGLAGLQSIYPNAPPYNISYDGLACWGTNGVTFGNASQTITAAGTCAFSPSMNGKKAFANSGFPPANSTSGTNLFPIGTFTYVNATTGTMSSTSAGACAGGCNFVVFTDDRSKWCCGAGTVDNAIQTAKGCVAVFSPAGMSPLPFGFGLVSSPICGQVSGQNQLTEIDNGNAFIGLGSGSTLFVLPPDTDFTKCTGAGSATGVSNGCLFTGFSSLMRFGVTGAGFGVTGTHAVAIVAPSAQANFIEQLALTAFASGPSETTTGIEIPFSNENTAIYADGFGAFSCVLSGVNVILTDSFCGDSGRQSLIIAGSGTVARIANTYIGGSVGTIGLDVGFAAGVPEILYCSQCQSYGGLGSGGAHIFVASGSSLYLDQWYNASGSAYGVVQTATSKVYVHNSNANGSTHCFGTQGVTLTTGAFFNQGGNTCSGAVIETTLQPTITGTGFGTGTIALTGAFITNEQVNFTITPAGSPATTGTIVDTFNMTPSVNGNPPACILQLGNGTENWTAPVTILNTAKSTTAYTWAWTAGAAPGTTGTLTGVITCTPN